MTFLYRPKKVFMKFLYNKKLFLKKNLYKEDFKIRSLRSSLKNVFCRDYQTNT